MDSLYVVWYSSDNHLVAGWLPSEAMSREAAESYAHHLETGGFQTIIYPRHTVSRLDLVEG